LLVALFSNDMMDSKHISGVLNLYSKFAWCSPWN